MGKQFSLLQLIEECKLDSFKRVENQVINASLTKYIYIIIY
jgi:hypothetical protein